ncbi:hypothetical protein [Acetobacter fallax]|nr:hypothetical protein [Acetobacter fallax]
MRSAGGLIFLFSFLLPYFVKIAGGDKGYVAVALVLCQGVGLALITGRWVIWPVVTVLLVFLALMFPDPVRNADALVIYCVGLILPLRLFISSLAPGREPLVSALARQAHGGGVLRDDIARYTSLQTWFWVVFLFLLLLLPPVLFLVGPPGSWLWPLKGSVLGVLAVLLVAEYGVRRLVIRNFDHMPPWAMVHVWKTRSSGRT